MDSRQPLIIEVIMWGMLCLFTATIISLIIVANWLVSVIIGVLSGLLEILFYYFKSWHNK